MMRFHEGWVRVAVLPVWVPVAFQTWLMRWSPPKVKVITQSTIGVEPVLVTVMSATKPVAHTEVFVKLARQDRAGAGGLDEAGGLLVGEPEPPVTVTTFE